jgi:hypothetical protein
MKQLVKFIRIIFKKQKTYSTLFSEAMSEGIRDTLKEMGYGFSDNADSNSQSKK